MKGLEKAKGDLSKVSSVASFFVSRVDVLVDKKLEALGTDEATALLGKVSIIIILFIYFIFYLFFIFCENVFCRVERAVDS